MHKVCKFLHFDVLCLLRNEEAAEGCCPKDLVNHPSYTIRNKYPEVPTIYDGETANERRCIRIDDITESYLDFLLAKCGTKSESDMEKEDCDVTQSACQPEEESECGTTEQEEQSITELKELAKALSETEPKEIGECLSSVQNSKNCSTTKETNFGKCCQLYQTIINTFAKKICSLVAPNENDKKAKELYEAWLKCENNENCIIPWKRLKSLEKLPFYWHAIAKHPLNLSPFENFKCLFIEEIKENDCGLTMKQINEQAYIMWENLDQNERFAFTMEIFICAVASGEVDLMDEQQIKCIVQKLKRLT